MEKSTCTTVLIQVSVSDSESEDSEHYFSSDHLFQRAHKRTDTTSSGMCDLSRQFYFIQCHAVFMTVLLQHDIPVICRTR